MWQPTASIEDLKKRAALIQAIRQFFIERGLLEVETPLMAASGVTDVYLHNFEVQDKGQTCFLQTSPEFHMKRLLAAGSGSIFQIAKAFRVDECGRLHNREFTLLEWYRLGFSHHDLMREVDELLQSILSTKPAVKLTYRTLFERYLCMNPLSAGKQQLYACLKSHGLERVLGKEIIDVNQGLHLLMAAVIEPKLAQLDTPVIVYDYPASQAALAKSDQEVAARFEVYFQGIELANGFDELCDPVEQKARFEQDNRLREALNLPPQALDPRFIAALEHGLPACSGVALGIDRLLLLALGKKRLSEVLSFDATNA